MPQRAGRRAFLLLQYAPDEIAEPKDYNADSSEADNAHKVGIERNDQVREHRCDC